MITNYLSTITRKKKERAEWALVILEYLMVIGIVIGAVLMLTGAGKAEDEEGQQCWVLCHPDSCVCLRAAPRKTGIEFGGAMLGADMLTDGKTRNGYLHVFDLNAEETAGWISCRYVVFDEPREIECELRVQAQGRVAVRKWINGKIIKWMHDGDQIYVYAMSDEWAVTDRGYIKTEFLEEPQG